MLSATLLHMKSKENYLPLITFFGKNCWPPVSRNKTGVWPVPYSRYAGNSWEQGASIGSTGRAADFRESWGYTASILKLSFLSCLSLHLRSDWSFRGFSIFFPCCSWCSGQKKHKYLEYCLAPFKGCNPIMCFLMMLPGGFDWTIWYIFVVIGVSLVCQVLHA